MKKMRRKRRPVIEPKTYYSSLGEDGLLEEYVRENLRDKFETEPEFHEEMIGLLFKFANNVVPEVEKFYLTKLGESLNEFLESVKQWKTAKP